MTPARIACIYRSDRDLALVGMDTLRVFRMAEALARRGHRVDLIVNRRDDTRTVGPRLREVPYTAARWDDYDVVKTFFHAGFASLRDAGGADHPFIVSKLGSVVADTEMPGVYFFGAVRERLYRIQEDIARRSRSVTVLTERSAAVWRRMHGPAMPLTRVPTGVDAEIPPPGANPAARLGITRPVVLFAGNIYDGTSQPEVNAIWQERLNTIGRRIRGRGLQLVAMGRGDRSRLDGDAVVHLGVLDASAVWDWQRHARAGIVLAHGPVQDNESSKIYYYLRTGLPVVCERSVPNAALVLETGHGAVVDYGDDAAFANAAATVTSDAARADEVGAYMVRHHSWDARAALYDDLFSMAAAPADRIAQRSSAPA